MVEKNHISELFCMPEDAAGENQKKGKKRTLSKKKGFVKISYWIYIFFLCPLHHFLCFILCSALDFALFGQMSWRQNRSRGPHRLRERENLAGAAFFSSWTKGFVDGFC